jgi:hypothetical protein
VHVGEEHQHGQGEAKMLAEFGAALAVKMQQTISS